MSNKALVSRALMLASWQQGIAAGSLLTSHAIFCNPSGSNESYEVKAIHGYWDVIGGASAAATVRNTPTSTAMASGTSIGTAAFDLTATARAPQRLTLATSAATRRIDPGYSVTLSFGGTLTGLVGLLIHVYLEPIRGSRQRR